jgi:hypothetical protein
VIALAILASAAVAGCGGSKSEVDAPSTERAQGFADDFVRKLVVDGRWEPIAGDVAPLLTRQMRNFQETIRRDGVRRVDGPGVLRHDCPQNPAVEAGPDCFHYRLSGRQAIPAQGTVPLKASYRLWVAHEDGRWQVVSYEYDLIPTG